MKLKVLNGIFYLVALASIASCKRCVDRVCENISDEYKTWIPHQLNDTLRYKNGSGKYFTFLVSAVKESENDTQECFRSLSSCSCHSCKPYYSITASGDSTRNNSNVYSLKVSYTTQVKHSETIVLRKDYALSFLGMEVDFDLDYISQSTDSLISNGLVYKNVFHSQIDTLNTAYSTYQITEVYCSKQLGLIAFYDRKTKDWYYRQ